MGMNRLSGRLPALFLAGWALGACAGGDFLAKVSLDEADKRLMEEATLRALEKNKVGQGANWRNPESGALGTVTPTATRKEKSGKRCRDYQQTVTLGGKTWFAYDTACRKPKGGWESVNYAALAGSRRFEARGHPYGRRHPYGYGYPYGFGHRHGFGFSIGGRYGFHRRR
ncbi:MAG: RT0821/Lpp0805 family surface protein [bacterium]